MARLRQKSCGSAMACWRGWFLTLKPSLTSSDVFQNKLHSIASDSGATGHEAAQAFALQVPTVAT